MEENKIAGKNEVKLVGVGNKKCMCKNCICGKSKLNENKDKNA